MKNIKIKIIKSSLNCYIIKRNRNGFFCQIKTRNLITLLREYYNDFIGLTYKHPQFLINMYFSTIDEMERHIQVSVKIDDKKKVIETTQKMCSFCSTLLTKKDIENPNDYILSCYKYKELAQIVTEKHFRENPNYTQWKSLNYLCC